MSCLSDSSVVAGENAASFRQARGASQHTALTTELLLKVEKESGTGYGHTAMPCLL